eukprot:UN12315
MILYIYIIVSYEFTLRTYKSQQFYQGRFSHHR